MSMLEQESVITFRGMSLHKMIRFITFALGGDVKVLSITKGVLELYGKRIWAP
jgi:hypothetical protein